MTFYPVLSTTVATGNVWLLKFKLKLNNRKNSGSVALGTLQGLSSVIWLVGQHRSSRCPSPSLFCWTTLNRLPINLARGMTTDSLTSYVLDQPRYHWEGHPLCVALTFFKQNQHTSMNVAILPFTAFCFLFTVFTQHLKSDRPDGIAAGILFLNLGQVP